MKKARHIHIFLFIIITVITGICCISPDNKKPDIILKLWTNTIPQGAKDNSSQNESKNKNGRTINVTEPTISVYQPENKLEKTPAVLICPGGGYGWLASDHEGVQIAEWLNSIGITGIVLKYRLPSDNIMEDKKIGPLQDAQQAMRLIRKHANEWNIIEDKIGVIGFSAGGHLAATLTTQYNKIVYESENISARPDFSILVYPVISMQDSLTHMGSRINLLGDSPTQQIIDEFSNELQVSENTPPCFLIHSSDDGAVNYLNSILFYEALVQHNVPAEMHIFPSGGHGYGLATNKPNLDIWPKNLENWLNQILN